MGPLVIKDGSEKWVEPVQVLQLVFSMFVRKSSPRMWFNVTFYRQKKGRLFLGGSRGIGGVPLDSHLDVPGR